MAASSKKTMSWGQRIAVGAALAAVLAVMFAEAGRIVPRSVAADHDFISYWTTAKLLAARANPYDRAAILAMEHQQGASYGRPYIMRNPPWALVLTLPLAVLDLSRAALVWMLAIVAAALGALGLMKPARMKAIPLTAIFFAPTLMCVGAEQTSVFVLLGLALFIRCQARRPLVAGLALTLAMMKPHLLVLFFAVLLLECWRRREIRILAGLAAGLAATSLAAMALDAQVWAHYFAAMRAEQMEAGFYPNISSLLRSVVAPGSMWPQALPTGMAVVWAVWYWARARERWDWMREGGMVLGVSVLVAPYSWAFDQVLFLPAVLMGLAFASRRTGLALALLNGCAIVVALGFPVMGNLWYLWTAPAWMVWCAWAYRSVPAAESRERAAVGEWHGARV